MAKIKPKWIVVILMVLIGLGIYGSLVLRGGPDLESQLDPSISAGVTFSQVQLVGRADGERQWEITSGSMRTKDDIVFLDQLQQVTMLQERQPKYYIQASKGIWDRATDTLEFFDNVSLQESDGFQLWTTKMIWYAQTEELEFFGETIVEFTQGGGNDDEKS